MGILLSGSDCGKLLDELTLSTTKNNERFVLNNPKCQNCTLTSGSVPQPQPLSTPECMACYKFLTKTKAEQRERLAKADEAAVSPTISEADVEEAVVVTQEAEIRHEIYKIISSHKEYLDGMMKNLGEHMLPGPGTVIQSIVFLTTPLIRELYERLKMEYAEHDIFLGAHAVPNALFFNYLW